MREFIFGIALFVGTGFGLSACSDDPPRAPDEQTEADCKQNRVDRIEELQKRAKVRELTAIEQEELDGLYKELELEAQDPKKFCAQGARPSNWGG